MKFFKPLFSTMILLAIAGFVVPGAVSVAVASGYDDPGNGGLDPMITYIVDPVFGMPAFWVAGGGGGPEIVLNTTGGGINGIDPKALVWTVTLEKSVSEIPYSVELPIIWKEYRPPNFILHPEVPADVPVDLYDLVVTLRVGGNVYSDFQPHAVKVVDEIKDDFSFIQVTDIHVDDIRGYLVNFDETTDYKVIKKMIEMVNLLNPEFIVITGDIVFGDSYAIEYPDVYNLFLTLDVPIFMSVGNHDAINHDWLLGIEKIDGLHTFEDFFAPLDFVIQYGDMEYISLNSMDWTARDRQGIGVATSNWQGQMRSDQLDWYEDQLAQADTPLLITGYHHPPQTSFGGQGADRVMQLARDYLVDNVLLGHTHADNFVQDGSVGYITTNSLLFDEVGYPAVRKLDVYDGELVSWNYEEPKYSMPVYKDSGPGGEPLGSLSTAAMSVDFYPSNDATSDTVTATVHNYLEFDYQGLSIEFYMPDPGEGMTYAVDGGIVRDAVSADGGWIWYVEVDVDVNSETVVTISPEPL